MLGKIRIYNLMRFSFNGLPKKFLSSRIQDLELFRLESADEILAKHRETIASIRQSAGISDALFDRLYLGSISRAAALMQSCPATAGGHHSWPGGLFAHSLESSAYTLRLRKGKIMPAGASPEQESKKEDLYTYAVFHAALLHDLGESLDNQRIALYDRRRTFVAEWRPLYEDLVNYPKARYMKIEFRQDPVNRHRPISSLMYVIRILDREGCAWLQSDPDVYNDFLHAFGDNPRGSIYQMVALARKFSRDRDTGSESPTSAPLPIRSEPGTSEGEEARQPEQEKTETRIETNPGHAADEAGTSDIEIPGDAESGNPGNDVYGKDDPGQPMEVSEEVLPGETFRRWVETGINDSTFVVNGKSALVHIGRTNIFLVAPGIFETYAATNSMDWETEQRQFLSLEIHTKNGEKDWWYARVQPSGKMERIRGVLVPLEHFDLKSGLPVNEQMAVLKK